MTLAAIQTIKIGVCIVAIGLVVAFWLSDRGFLRSRRLLTSILVALAAFSIPCYFDFGSYPKHGRFMNPHGWFHYYLGSKYSRELGYENLYRAVIIADRENTGTTVQRQLRNLDNYQLEDINSVIRRGEEYKTLFTPARWQTFRQDVAYFRSIFIPRRWPGVVTDKGYNGTPPWNVVGGILSNLVPTSSRIGMSFLLSLDLVLSALMLMLVWQAFGGRAALFMMIYLCTHFAFYTYNVNEIRGAFLRLDWVAFSVMSVCLLKLNRYKTAGAVLAYAAMARIFPIILVFGVGVKFAWDFVRTRTLNKQYMSFFAAFGGVIAVLVVASIAWSGGLGSWQDFIEKIRMHDSGLSAQRTGFKYVFLQLWPGMSRNEALFAQSKALWWSIQAIVLAVACVCVLRLEDYEALAFSYVPLFFLMAPTTYYHIGLLVPLLFFLPKMRELPRSAGVALMFAITALFAGLNNVKFHGGTWQFSLIMSCTLLLLMFYMVALSLAMWRKKPAISASQTLPNRISARAT